MLEVDHKFHPRWSWERVASDVRNWFYLAACQCCRTSSSFMRALLNDCSRAAVFLRWDVIKLKDFYLSVSMSSNNPTPTVIFSCILLASSWKQSKFLIVCNFHLIRAHHYIVPLTFRTKVVRRLSRNGDNTWLEASDSYHPAWSWRAKASKQ